MNLLSTIPANVYLFKVSTRNIRKRYEMRSKLAIKTPGLWTYFTLVSKVSIVDLEQVNVSWNELA